jgi:hypothetical protein
MIDLLLLGRRLATRGQRTAAGWNWAGEAPLAQVRNNPVARQCHDARQITLRFLPRQFPTELRAHVFDDPPSSVGAPRNPCFARDARRPIGKPAIPHHGGRCSAAVCSAAKLGKKFLLLPLVFP